jgi:hypothetical protein
MSYYRSIGIILTFCLIGSASVAVADRLPQGVPENQVFSLYSMIETIGVVMQKTSAVWQVSDGGLDSLGDPAKSSDGNSVKGNSIAYAAYSDFIMTNGGEFSEVKTMTMDTNPQTPGMYNIETTRVLTYNSINGSHLMGEESYVLDVAGQWSYGGNDITCVFSKPGSSTIPAFCNKATASSKLRSVTSAQIETRGSMTAVGKDASVPAALNYEISVTPDSNSVSGYADGVVSTTFTVSVMEGRSSSATSPDDALEKMLGIYNQTSSTISAVDTTTVSGGITAFNKVFTYQSGIACVDC